MRDENKRKNQLGLRKKFNYIDGVVRISHCKTVSND